MSVLEKATSALSEIESELLASRDGNLDPARLAKEVHRVRELLSGPDAAWIGTAEAQRILGAHTESSVKTLARLELIRSRPLPDGRIEVLLDDVLYRRRERDAHEAIGGEDLTEEELRIMREERPGKNPWEREKAEQRG